MRKKPPAGVPHINAGKPWSPLDVTDLAECLEEGRTVEEIADLLCRAPDEISARIALFGLQGAKPKSTLGRKLATRSTPANR